MATQCKYKKKKEEKNKQEERKKNEKRRNDIISPWAPNHFLLQHRCVRGDVYRYVMPPEHLN